MFNPLTPHTPIDHTGPVPDPARRQHILELEDRITALSAHIDAATFQFLELVREYDDCGGWSGPGLRSCAHWLNWRCGIGMSAARERVRVAHAIEDLPRTRALFRQGRISYSKVRALTRAATAKNEETLLNIALNGTAGHLELAVRQFRRVKRRETLEQERERHALRELNWYFDDDGCLVLKGRFTPEQGAIVRQALESVLEEQYAELKNVSAETSDADDVFSPPRPQPIASRRADALVRLAESWLAGVKNDAGSGDLFLVHVHTDLETLKEDGTGSAAEIEATGDVSAETARKMACDAAIIHWLENADGEPLSVGRKTRSVPPAIRRALQRRDRGCRFPGCTATRFVDAHHVHHWADGGATHIDNLVLLCRHHHRLVHEGGYGLARTIDGAFRFARPDGRLIPEAPAPRFRGNARCILDLNVENGIHITPKTPVPGWLGERMDLSIVLENLMRHE
jgi:hypothetical protein